MSRPTRARGLKHGLFSLFPPAIRVAPHAGAWIETCPQHRPLPEPPSRPTRARGLKHRRVARCRAHVVAPHAGAWIETVMDVSSVHALCRAPRGRVD